MFSKKQVAMVVAEFVGTYALVSAVLNASRIGLPYFPASAAALTLGVMVLVIGPISGAHINPAVTFGMWTLKKISSVQAVAYIVTQLLAALAALGTNQFLLNHSLPALTDNKWHWRVILAEGIGTFIFTFGIAAAVYNKYEGGKLAAAIGASLFVGVMAASFAAVGALNPAVALGVNAWSVSYIVGPLLGSVIGMNLYARLLAPTIKSSKR